MAEDTATQRTFTEGEAYALVDQAVVRETAAATERATTAETTVSELQSRIDVLETEKAAEKARADAAEKAIADDKAEREAAAEREAKRTERLEQVATANPHLPLANEDGTPHERADRIVAMSDDAFTSYLTDMREVAAKVTVPPVVPGTIPRATAAFGGDNGGDVNSDKPSVKGLHASRRAVDASVHTSS